MVTLGYPPTPVSPSTEFDVPDWPGLPTDMPHPQDVAIVGMSCRTAGGNDTPEKLWKFLMKKQHASGEVPKKRWEPWLRRDPRNAKIIEKTTTKGYFLNDLENFDAAFFGISPKEAELMDPHQRLGLELSWEALENSGIDPKKLAGSDTAVFMGVDSDDYSRLIMEDLPNIEAWSGIGTAYHGIPNRISYHLDLMGPSTAIDAACASSLIAIHLGRQAIMTGESTVALCGGVNVLCAPGLTHMLDKAGALSPDGVCLSFDDNAHGYARGEGGAIIVLKKLTRAIDDEDNILAVLKGTATAQDGKTNGILAPNAKAQEMVARQALLRAGSIDPSTIGYVEAHATSTPLGDPIELGAISRVYGVGRPNNTPCAIGSIKPNVGHLEAAAGAIGFVKAVLAVQKNELAPQALLKRLNTRIDWKNSGLEVVQECSAWPKSSGLRRAAVCSYGYGGSVSHAVIEQAPPAYIAARAGSIADAHTKDQVVSLVLSSFQEKRLPGQASHLADWLTVEGKNESLQAIATTLAQRRAAQDYRASFIVTTHEDAILALRNFAIGKSNQWVTSHRVLGSNVKKDVVWVFSGHGAQWADMGKQLIKNTTFFKTIAAIDSLVQREAGFSALSALETSNLGGSDRVQVLTYLMQIGLAEVLRVNGVQPRAIIGHSVGEIAASVVAGCMTPEEGVLVVSRRAKLYRQVQNHGGMALVYLNFSQVAHELSGRRDIVAAVESSPSSCVVSGEIAVLEQFVSGLHERGIQTFWVRTDVAFHSPMLEKLVKPMVESLSNAIRPRPATIALYSTSNFDPRSSRLRDIEYWTNNMVCAVRLQRAVDAAIADEYRIFLEVSTHPIVTQSIAETLAYRGLDQSASVDLMKRDSPAEKCIVLATAQLHTLGVAVDFKTQLGTCHWATTVPGTPWVQKPYWKQVETAPPSTRQQHDVETHNLLGKRIDIAGADTVIFNTTLDNKTKPYPLSHPFDKTEIIPAAVYCNTFYQATNATILKGLQLRVPMSMTSELRDVQVVVQGDHVQLSSRIEPLEEPFADLKHPWIHHSSCRWSKQDMAIFRETYDVDSIRKRIGTVLPTSFAWAFLQRLGVSGIAYPWTVLEHYGNDKEMIVKMDMDPTNAELTWSPQSWAPFLDAATSVGSSIFFNKPRMRLVSGIEQVQFVSLKNPPKLGYLYIEEASDEKSSAANISLLSEQGDLLTKLTSMRFSDVEPALERTVGIESLVHQLSWVPPAFAETPLPMDHVLLISSEADRSMTYAKSLEPFVGTLTLALTVNDFDQPPVVAVLGQKNVIVVYVPNRVDAMTEVSEEGHKFTWEAARILKALVTLESPPKLFIITDSVHKAQTPTALAQAPLHGFARIAAQEHPELWGGLIDTEGSHFPLLAIKYVQEQDVICIQDGLPRIARLRPFANTRRYDAGSHKTLLPKPHGTYVVTGGFGDLGLAILEFLVTKGAHRIVVVSRRTLPSRHEWRKITGQMKVVVDKIQTLEARGATIYGIPLDIGAPDTHTQLLSALDRLDLPPVLGVVHAAGINEDGLIRDTTSFSFFRVLNPKVSGALALHSMFPPATLDFFILFSSIGQLVGTSGQAPYGAANAFLDTLATYRRAQGDNAIAFQWTAWRGMGLAAGSKFLTVELASKGITDITSEEGFQAWEHLSQYDTDHAIVTRARFLDPDEPIPFPLMTEVAPRRPHSIAGSSSTFPSPSVDTNKPLRGPALNGWLTIKVKECISAVLYLDVEDIDTRSVVADLGVDSVMAVALRQKLHSVLGVKVPPTLMWKVHTVDDLVDWFEGKINLQGEP